MDTSDVLARVQKLDADIDFLREKRAEAPTIQAYLENKDLQLIVERVLQLSAQICIDLANYFVSIYGLAPDRVESIYRLLAQENIIPFDLGEWLAASARFRNILVHRYLVIDPVKVYKTWQEELDRFQEFANIALELVEKDQAGE